MHRNYMLLSFSLGEKRLPPWFGLLALVSSPSHFLWWAFFLPFGAVFLLAGWDELGMARQLSLSPLLEGGLESKQGDCVSTMGLVGTGVVGPNRGLVITWRWGITCSVPALDPVSSSHWFSLSLVSVWSESWSHSNGSTVVREQRA